MTAFDPVPRRIAVFRALQLGDLLCAVPALRALRAAAPAARIALVGLPGSADLASRLHAYVDELLVFPGAPGFPEQTPRLGELPAFIHRAHACQFDLAIQLHGSGELSNAVVRRLGAARCAGFVPPGTKPPDRWFMPWPRSGSEILRNLALMRFLGAQHADTSLELPIADHEWTAWHWLAAQHGLVRGRFVCVHPGARLPSRRWPFERFATVADELAHAGWPIVVTGSREEAGLAQALRRTLAHRGRDCIDLTGRTSLGVLAALLCETRLLVCNDTGVSHVAAAVGAPSVVIACGSDPERWAPLDALRHRVLAHDVDCRPCAYADCPTGHECALGVTVDMVLRAAAWHLDTAEDEVESHAA